MASDSRNHQIISKSSHADMYAMLAGIIREHHPKILGASFILLWRYGLKRDKDGLLVLGKCKKASDYDKAFTEYDFVILLNKEAWNTLSDKQRLALMDHELSHATSSVKKKTGEIVYRVRKHDIEEFRGIVERHGCYKADLAAFVDAAVKASKPTLFKGDDDAPTAVPIPSKVTFTADDMQRVQDAAAAGAAAMDAADPADADAKPRKRKKA